MNTSPFALNTQFFPEDAGHDKIDLELGKWNVLGLLPDEESVHEFKSYLSSPPEGQEDFAWNSDIIQGAKPLYGAFLCRPEKVGRDRNKLKIRKQAVIHPFDSRRREAPLCGGYCLFYLDKARLPITGDFIHHAKLRLSLNLQRFIRHQPQQDDPRKPWQHRLQRRKEDRSVYEDEQSLDGQDNWVPDTQGWRKFAAKEHLGKYLELISDQMGEELSRACRIFEESVLQIDRENDWERIGWESEEGYSLSQVETLWEFPSSNPITEVWDLGTKLMHLPKQGGTAAIQEMEIKEAGRVLNSPCFSIPLAEGVRLKLYAKTNKRIRFEIVQSKLWKQRAALLKEAGILSEDGRHSWDEVPRLLKVIRQRAAEHMNNIMEHLRTKEMPDLKPKRLIELLVEVASAVPATILKQTRMDKIQTVLIWLCFYKGYRGGINKGPYSEALKTLAARDVIKFDPVRKFYVLSDAYKAAGEALASVAGDPLLSAMGLSSPDFMFQKNGKPIRLRD